MEGVREAAAGGKPLAGGLGFSDKSHERHLHPKTRGVDTRMAVDGHNHGTFRGTVKPAWTRLGHHWDLGGTWAGPYRGLRMHPRHHRSAHGRASRHQREFPLPVQGPEALASWRRRSRNAEPLVEKTHATESALAKAELRSASVKPIRLGCATLASSQAPVVHCDQPGFLVTCCWPLSDRPIPRPHAPSDRTNPLSGRSA